MKSIIDEIVVEGMDMNKMPPHFHIIALLVKRLGGNVIITDNEFQIAKIKGMVIQLTGKESVVIKVE